MILDFTAPLTSIQGEAQEGKTLAHSLSNFLANFSRFKTEADIFRVIGWGQELVKTGKLSANEGDIKTLKSFIVEHEVMSTILKYHLLKICDEALEDSKNEKP